MKVGQRAYRTSGITYPCVCHPDRKHRANGLCGPCYQYLKKADIELNFSSRADKLRSIVAGHSARKDVTIIARRKSWLETKRRDQDGYEKGRDKSLRDRYGLTLKEYNEMLSKQGEVCAICRLPSKNGRPLHVDHRHDNGLVRGLLCSRCNILVGVFDTYDAAFLLLVERYAHTRQQSIKGDPDGR